MATTTQQQAKKAKKTYKTKELGPQTPIKIQQAFLGDMFPFYCYPDKKKPGKYKKGPDVGDGYTWQKSNEKKKPLVRAKEIVEGKVFGIDLAEQGLTAADIDFYDSLFETDPRFNELARKIIALSTCGQETPSARGDKRGIHRLFKGTIDRNYQYPFGVHKTGKLKGVGISAIEVFSHKAFPFYSNVFGEFETFEKWKESLTPSTELEKLIENFRIEKKIFIQQQQKSKNDKDRREFGAGANDQAIQDWFPGKDIKTQREGLKKLFASKPSDSNIEKAIRNIRDYQKKEAKEPLIFTYPDEQDFDLMENVPKVELDYVDPETKIILNKNLVTLTGPKGVGKSGGLLTLLLKLGKKVLYYSDMEVMRHVVDQYNELAQGKWKKDAGFIYRFNGRKLTDDDYFKSFKAFIKEKKIDVIFEDPPYETNELFYTQDGLRKSLGSRNYHANELGKVWIVTRNHNQQGFISGFKIWENLPRAVIEFYKILPTSKTSLDLFKTQKQSQDELKKLSLLRTKIANLGKMPEKALILKQYSNPKYPSIPDIAFDDIKRPIDSSLKSFCEGPTTKEKQQTESNESYSLAILNEAGKKGLSSGIWQKKIVAELKVVDKTARNYIKTLLDDGLIKGKKEGRTTTFTLTAKGEVFLDSLNR